MSRIIITIFLFLAASFQAHGSRATDISGSALAYDVKGNLLSMGQGSALWDIDNHLQQIFTGNINSPGMISYEYDALGRRVLKHVDKEKIVFVCKGQRVIAEYKQPKKNTPFELQREYVYGTYVDDILAKVEADNSILYYHSDRQFNVRGLTDSVGNIIELYAYTVYGKQVIIDPSSSFILPTSSFGNAYGYTGRYLDDETSLWYFRARYFSDEMGRFINRDPLGYVDGMSLYQGYFAQGFGLDPMGKAHKKKKQSTGSLKGAKKKKHQKGAKRDPAYEAVSRDKSQISRCTFAFSCRRFLRNIWAGCH